MWDSEDWVEFVLNLNVVSSPGNEFNYNTGASHLLSAILTKATGMSTLDFAQGNLFNPLGIEPQDWPVDPQGINKGGEGLELSALALAKFGLLYLNNGSWNSAQIVPKDWILKSSKDYHPQRGSAYGYGYQWWIHNDETVYSAWGYAEQRIIIVPKYNVVAVFTAYMRDASGDIAGNIVNTFIIPSIQNFLPFGSTLTTKIFSYNPRVSSSIDFLFFLLSCISLIKFKKKNCKMKK
jgi:CubicO group peptidase (beta-lactamase class C family)